MFVAICVQLSHLPNPHPPPFLQPNYFQINIQMFSQFFLNAFLQLLHQQFL